MKHFAVFAKLQYQRIFPVAENHASHYCRSLHCIAKILLFAFSITVVFNMQITTLLLDSTWDLQSDAP